MSVIDWLGRQLKRDATHYVFATIPTDHQDKPVAAVDVTAENHYFRVWLSEMFLKEDRRLFREFVPVVHSAVRFQFAQTAAQELPYVAGPQNLGLGTTLGKGVQVDHALTNLLPFRGGTVTVAAALVAYKEKDFLKGFLDVLHDVSGILNVGQLSSALAVADSAVDGVQSLLGAGDKDVHLIYFQGFGGAAADGGAPLRSGYTAIISADAAKFDKTKLFVKERQLHYGSTLQAARPLEGYDYMLLRTEASTHRDDFRSFPQFAKLLQDAIREGHRDRPTGDKIIDTAKIVVLDSPDLTNTDRVYVARALKEEYETALAGPPPAHPLTVDEGLDVITKRVAAFSPGFRSGVAKKLERTRDLGVNHFMEIVDDPLD